MLLAQCKNVSCKSTDTTTSRKVELSMITRTPKRPRQGARHQQVMQAAVLAMCFSAVAASYGYNDKTNSEHKDRHEHLLNQSHNQHVDGRNEGEQRMRFEDFKPKLVDNQDWKDKHGVKCPRCEEGISKKYIEDFRLKNAFLRVNKGDAEEQEKFYGTFKFKNDEINKMCEERNIETEQQKKSFLEKTSHEKLQSKGIDCDPNTERGYTQSHWVSLIKWKTETEKSELFQCPSCGFESIVGEKNTLNKKFLDNNWKILLVGTSSMMGFGLASYIRTLREGDNIQGCKIGHFFFFVGMIILLFLLLRGHSWSWKHAKTGVLVIQIIGFASGLAAAGNLVIAMTNIEPSQAVDGLGNDLDYTSMLTKSTNSLWLVAIFGSMCIAAVIYINLKHNANVDGRGIVAGIFNLGLAASVTIGLCTFVDIWDRMCDPDGMVHFGTYALCTGCFIYVLYWLLIRTIWNGGNRWHQFMTLASGATMVACIFGVCDSMQSGLSDLPEGVVMQFGCCIFGAMLSFWVLNRYVYLITRKDGFLACFGKAVQAVPEPEAQRL